MLPVPTKDDLAEFTGQPLTWFPPFTDEALVQATLLFTIVTGLTDYPADPDMAQLAENAILEMAYRLILEQPYYTVAAGPFQSETIGSYSYSKNVGSAKTALHGKVGMFWWDLAVDELAVSDSGHAHGAVAVYNKGLRVLPDGSFKIREATEFVEDPDAVPAYIRIS